MAKPRSPLNAIRKETHPSLLRLFQARNEWDRLHQLSNILKEAQIDLPDFFDSPVVWSSICREADLERLAWRLSQEINRRVEGKLPRCLEPYADRPDLEREQQASDLAKFQSELQQWLQAETEAPAGTPRRELRVVWKIVPGLAPLSHQVQIELRANSPKLKEGPRNFFQVRGLCTELSHRPELFTAEDAVLLRWLSDYLNLLLTDKSKHGSPFLSDHRSLLAWLQHWGQTGRCRFEDGTPVSFSILPAQIVPALDESQGEINGDGVRLHFHVVTAGGMKEPLANAQLFLSNKEENGRLELELVCVNGCFHRLCERPPVALLALSGRHGPMRLEPAATRLLLPPLLRRFPSLQSQVRVHLKQVPAQVKFYFTLDADDTLRVRLQAAARQGSKVWEWGVFGWSASQGKPTAAEGEKVSSLAAPDAVAEAVDHFTGGEFDTAAPVTGIDFWDEVPAETDTLDAVEWLRQWGGEPGDLIGRPDELGWWLTLHGQTVGRLIRLWQERAHAWQYFGNRRFQQLITGRRRSFPKLKIQSSGVDWFTVKTEWEEESLKLTESDWQKLRQNTDPFIKLSDGSWLAAEEASDLSEAATALAELGLGLEEGEQRINTVQMAGVDSGLWQRLETSGGQWREELAKLKEAVHEFEGIPAIAVPAGLRAELRPYQQEGLNFLSYTSRLHLGAILADDMGLGKTVQALAWLQHLRETNGPAPCLVVCPASVVFNWTREANQFTPALRVLVLTAGEQRHELRKEIPEHDIIVTNYALLRRDLAELRKFSFRAIILDEAQYIKNPDSLVAKAARVLAGQHRLALTGTPLENRLLDLWSLAEFVLPGYLPSRARFTEEYDRGASPRSRALLSSRLRPLIMRRLKSQVAKDLPDRIEERIDCELTEGQRKFYLAELQRTRHAWRELDPADHHSRIHALAALTRLRQICGHPQLAGGKGNLGSGKTNAFLDLIDTLHAGGHKVLVFSQFVEMLKILQQELIARNRPHYLLTGQTTNRGEVVESFQADPRPAVFLLSLKAAGTGLNLTSASYVILYDPWWNPAVEAQAIDRTHRIGQHRTVIAYRLVTRDTVEEKIWQLQQTKSQLFKDVLGEQGFTASLSEADLDFLLAAPEEETQLA